MEKEEKYLDRKDLRLKDFDYSSAGACFITICTKNRGNFFWKIVNNEMILNEVGEIAENVWQEIPRNFNNVELGEFIVMPNHIHGNLVIKENVGASIYGAQSLKKDAINRAPAKGGFAGKNNPMGKKSLGEIIRWHKGRCSFEIRKNQRDWFSWQRNYYEHIIRDNKSWQKIQDYIIFNPKNWEKDENFMVL